MFHLLFVLSSSIIIITKSCPFDFESPIYLRLNDDSSFGLTDAGDENYRLGNETKPSYYKIEITSFEVRRFHGVVEIQFKALESNVRKVWLNAEHIVIDTAEIKIYPTSDPTTNIFDKLDISLHDKYQKYGFDLKNSLSPIVEYTIKIRYTATLYDDKDMRGLYTSHYKQNNETKTLYTTHFGQQARRLMPCWDENRFKAQFELIVHRNPTLHPFSISNAKRKEIPGNIDYYEPTSLISPYLLAIVMSDFKKNQNGAFSIHARPEAINQTDFALNLGVKLLDALDKWTNMPYYDISGVDKMDIAAIPDFSAVSVRFLEFESHLV